MGVEDRDIDRMQASGLSNSAQYKLAGNSIVVDVLYHIFRKLLVETQNEDTQPTLFQVMDNFEDEYLEQHIKEFAEDCKKTGIEWSRDLDYIARHFYELGRIRN